MLATLPPLLLLPLHRVRQVLVEREAARRHGVQPHQRSLRKQRPNPFERHLHLLEGQGRGGHGVTNASGGQRGQGGFRDDKVDVL